MTINNQRHITSFEKRLQPHLGCDHKTKTVTSVNTDEGVVWLEWESPAHADMAKIGGHYGSLIHSSSVSREYGEHILQSGGDAANLCKQIKCTYIKAETELGTVTGHFRLCGWRAAFTSDHVIFTYHIAGNIKSRIEL
mgnify:CR=1 FL=1